MLIGTPSLIWSATTGSINATVRVSVCGNNVKEGGEDCDNTAITDTCQTVGYGSGTLTCDISCSFDTSQCSGTPAPTPTSTPTSSSSSSSANSSTSTSIDATSTPTPTPLLQRTLVPVASEGSTTTVLVPVEQGETLPPFVRIFDVLGNGRIELIQLRKVITLWVDDWKLALKQPQNTSGHKNCDVNDDGVCDVKDLSVLLFYVER